MTAISLSRQPNGANSATRMRVNLYVLMLIAFAVPTVGVALLDRTARRR